MTPPTDPTVVRHTTTWVQIQMLARGEVVPYPNKPPLAGDHPTVLPTEHRVHPGVQQLGDLGREISPKRAGAGPGWRRQRRDRWMSPGCPPSTRYLRNSSRPRRRRKPSACLPAGAVGRDCASSRPAPGPPRALSSQRAAWWSYPPPSCLKLLDLHAIQPVEAVAR